MPEQLQLPKEKLGSIDLSDSFDYTKGYDLEKTLAAMGIKGNEFGTKNYQERIFAMENEKLYQDLKVIIDEEWLKFQIELINGKKTSEQILKYQNEAEFFSNRNVIENGLPTNDNVKCFEDEKRTKIFFETIGKKIQPGDRVLEVGAGTGILAIAAAKKGASEVLALEINSVTADFAKRVVARCEQENIIGKGIVKITEADALDFQTNTQEKYDALISENIYTGQFYELQMQINNHLQRFVDSSQNKIIPSGLVSGVVLTSLSPELAAKVEGKRDFVADDFKNESFQEKTQPKPYDYINLKVREELGFRNSIVHTVAEDGKIDSVSIFSLVQMSDDEGDYIRRNETKFLNDDIIIKLEDALDVKEGDEIEIYIAYRAADDPEQSDIRIKNLRTGQGVVNKKNFERFDPVKYINTYYPEHIDLKKYSWVLDVIQKELDANNKIDINSIFEKTRLKPELIENIVILNFQKKVTTQLLTAFPQDNIKVLDVGGGPTIYQHIAMSLCAGDITHSEYLKQNREEVERWLRDDQGFNWDEYFLLVKKIFQDDKSFQKILEENSQSDNKDVSQNAIKIKDLLASGGVSDFKGHLRKVIKHVKPVNVFKKGLEIDNNYDVVASSGREPAIDLLTTSFVTESATGKKQEWEQGMMNVMEKVKPGGYMSLAAIRKAIWYPTGVGEEKMPAVSVDENDIEKILADNGFEIINLEVLYGSDQEKDGYDGMIFVFAQKQYSNQDYKQSGS